MVDPKIKLSLTQLLTKVFLENFQPQQLVVEHSYRDGYFCHEASWDEFSPEDIQLLEQGMREWLAGPENITLGTRTRDQVLQYMLLRSSVSKSANTRKWPSNVIPVIQFGNSYWDYLMEEAELDKAKLHNFRLEKFNDGFLIRFFPDKETTLNRKPLHAGSRLFQIIAEIEQMGDVLNLATIHDVNTLVTTDEIRHILWVAEGFHEKRISQIADHIVKDFPAKRVISIAGPSSSGKTTFAKRLGIQLRVNGFKTLPISMDDFFIDREQIANGPNGDKDFETIDAMNIELLAQRLQTLLGGGSIPRRSYDFKTGVGNDLTGTINLGEWDLIVLEGIHGLNPKLTEAMGHAGLHHIYVSAITQLNIDSNHRFSTSDNRLLRRMVRDHLFRGYSPEDTLARWESVRHGEERNIFPFQEEADFMFNSSLLYELSVLAKFALPLLKNIPNTSPVKTEANRLELLLSLVEPMDENLVPGVSILREFIGKSDFQY